MMDMRQIKALMQEFDDSGLSKLKITQEGFELELEKAVNIVPAPVTAAPVQAVAAPVQAPTAGTMPAEPQSSALPANAEEILSPMVGTFYAAPSPDSAPFVTAGGTIKKGQTIAILEAMKIMNELEAEFDCKILEVLVSDGQAVEYDMPLFVVERV